MMRDGTVYLQVRKYGYYGQVRIIKSTQRRPSVLEENCVLVKIRIRVPDSVFQPLEPSAVVTIPEELVQNEVHVEAEDANA